jgi:hypothetical protein
VIAGTFGDINYKHAYLQNKYIKISFATRSCFYFTASILSLFQHINIDDVNRNKKEKRKSPYLA